MKKDYSQIKISGKSNSAKIPGPVFITSGSLPGELLLQWDAVEDARNYIIEYTSHGSSKWQIIDVVKDPRLTILGLKRGKEYHFRVAAAYNDSQSGWSRTESKKIK